ARRVLVGRHGLDGVLDRPGRGHLRRLPDAADPVVDLPDPARAADAGERGDHGLARLTRTASPTLPAGEAHQRASGLGVGSAIFFSTFRSVWWNGSGWPW